MRRLGLLTLVSALVLMVTTCDDDGGGAADTGGQDVVDEPDAVADVVDATDEEPTESLLIWADEVRAPVLAGIAPAFTEATGIDVTVEEVDFGNIRDAVFSQGPAGSGPDIFVGAHDWVGEFASEEAAEPIDLGGREDEFFEVALEAFTFEGELYAVPYATEAIAMYYNEGLVETPPTTFAELAAICAELSDITNCLGVPGGNDAPDAYHHYAFISAFGGYIFGYDPATGFDTSDVGLDSAGAIAGAQFLLDQVEADLIASFNYDDAKNAFLDGEQPFWMTGPWELGTLDHADMSFGVTTIPTMDGNTPRPFVGVQGFLISAYSENKAAASSFLMDFVALPETMRALHDADPRNPAYVAVYDEIAEDPVAAAFTLSAANGMPMPNVPEMGAVWGALGDNLLALRNQEKTAEEAMQDAAEAVRLAIGE